MPSSKKKPVTPFMIKTTGTLSPQFIKQSPTNIKVSNLMSNGVSFPDAKRIRSHKQKAQLLSAANNADLNSLA